MAGRDYDAIIVGASFAGLAVARRLEGRVLLLDRNEVGAVQTSACGTPLWVPQALGVADSVLQIHDKLTVRAPTRTVTYDLSEVPFCTFDYRRFCSGLLDQTQARFLRASVTGMEDGAVLHARHRGPEETSLRLVEQPAAETPVIERAEGHFGEIVGDGARRGSHGELVVNLEHAVGDAERLRNPERRATGRRLYRTDLVAIEEEDTSFEAPRHRQAGEAGAHYDGV